jgi:hypothetical protein
MLARLEEAQSEAKQQEQLAISRGVLSQHIIDVAVAALSPDYLGAFLSYAETLVWLEAAHASMVPARR